MVLRRPVSLGTKSWKEAFRSVTSSRRTSRSAPLRSTLANSLVVDVVATAARIAQAQIMVPKAYPQTVDMPRKNTSFVYAPRMNRILLVVICSVFLDQGTVMAQQGPSPERPFVFAREVWATPGRLSETEVPEAAFFDTKPTTIDVVTVAEGETNTGDGYVQRLRGWIEAPQTGSYRFFLASDDSSELWLSEDEDPGSMRLIAAVTGYTQPMEFARVSPQMSRAVTLIKGGVYYIEARHKEGTMDDHLSIGWLVPRSGFSDPYLIGTKPNPTFIFESWDGVGNGDLAGLTVFDSKPDRSTKRATMTSPTDCGTNVATRLRGELVVPRTGEYVFMLSADDQAILSVSTSGNPAELAQVCRLASWVDPGNWGAISEPIVLEKGQKILVEARHYQGTGPGHIHVGWKGPKGFQQLPIRSNPEASGA